MHIVLLLSFVSILILPINVGCNLETKSDPLTDYEKRLAEFRKDFEQDAKVFEESDKPKLEGMSVTRNKGGIDDNHQVVEPTERIPDKTDRCCFVGKLLAERGLRCDHNRFSKADRGVRLKLVNSTLSHLGIAVTETNRQTLYQPFRICVLRNARELDKCCLLNENSKSGYNKKEHSFELHHKQTKVDRRYGSGRPRSKFESGDAMKGDRKFRKPLPGRRGQRGRGGYGLHRDNYKWSRWADYRSYRARQQQLRMARRGHRERDTAF